MEDVFLLVAEEEEAAAAAADAARSSTKREASAASRMSDPLLAPGKPSERPPAAFFSSQVAALLQKRVAIARRDYRAFVCQLCIPVLMLLGGLLLVRVAIPSELPDLVLSTSPLNADLSKNGLQPVYPNIVPAFAFKAHAPASIDSSDWLGLLRALPAANVSTASPLFNVSDAITITDPAGFVTAAASPQVDLQRMAAALLDAKPSMAGSMYGAYVPLLTGSIAAQDAAEVFVNGSAEVQLSYAAMFNMSAFHGAPLFMNILNSAAYCAVATGSPCPGDQPAPASITVRNHPLPYTKEQSLLLNSYLSGTGTTIMMIAYAFIPAAIAAYVVKEREVGMKHQEMLAGMSSAAYWISCWIWDFLAYVPTAVLCVALYFAFGIKDYTSTDSHRIYALLMLLFQYGLVMPPFTYTLSHAFMSHTSAQNAVLLINMLALLLMIASMIMGQALQNAGLCAADGVLRYVWRTVAPGFNLGNGGYSLAFLSILPSLNANCARANGKEVTAAMLQPYDAFNLHATGTNMVFFTLQLVVFPVLCFALDEGSPVAQRFWSCFGAAEPALSARDRKQSATDDDVLAEQARMRAVVPAVHGDGARSHGRGAGPAEDTIRIQDLWKAYPGAPPKIAVKGLSVGVHRGEIFGFLGINGE